MVVRRASSSLTPKSTSSVPALNRSMRAPIYARRARVFCTQRVEISRPRLPPARVVLLSRALGSQANFRCAAVWGDDGFEVPRSAVTGIAAEVDLCGDPRALHGMRDDLEVLR